MKDNVCPYDGRPPSCGNCKFIHGFILGNNVHECHHWSGRRDDKWRKVKLWTTCKHHEPSWVQPEEKQMNRPVKCRVKTLPLEAMQLETKFSKDVEPIVHWLNHGADDVVAWSDGQDLFIVDMRSLEMKYRAIEPGTWIVKNGDKLEFHTEAEFNAIFDKDKPPVEAVARAEDVRAA